MVRENFPILKENLETLPLEEIKYILEYDIKYR